MGTRDRLGGLLEFKSLLPKRHQRDGVRQDSVLVSLKTVSQPPTVHTTSTSDKVGQRDRLARRASRRLTDLRQVLLVLQQRRGRGSVGRLLAEDPVAVRVSSLRGRAEALQLDLDGRDRGVNSWTAGTAVGHEGGAYRQRVDSADRHLSKMDRRTKSVGTHVESAILVGLKTPQRQQPPPTRF